MLTSKIRELAQYKAKIAELEKAVVAEREAQLQRLHTELGYDSREDLINALRAAGRARPAGAARKGRRGRKKRSTSAAAAPKPARKTRRKRTKITPELRANIEAAVRSGATGAAVAKQFGVSLPTVQNIKRAAGLTRTSRGS